MYLIFFFFNDTATTEIYTLSLHDALPISDQRSECYCLRFIDADIRCTGEHRKCSRHSDLHHHPDFQRMQWSTGELRGDRKSEPHTTKIQPPDHHLCHLLFDNNKSE